MTNDSCIGQDTEYEILSSTLQLHPGRSSCMFYQSRGNNPPRRMNRGGVGGRDERLGLNPR